MALETVTHISDLVATNPTSTDPKSEGDNHLRNIKTALLTDFPAITGAVTASQAELNILDGATLSTAELNVLDGITATTAELNYTDGVTSAIQTQLDGKQPLDADLTAVAGLASAGLIARTGAGTAAARTLTAGPGIQISNGDGVSANPTIAVTAAAGLGDVNGPTSSTDNAISRFDSTTGRLLQNSTVTVGDLGEVAGVFSMNGGQLAGLRNKIVNGKMEIAQRGTSFVSPASNTYNLDRWVLGIAGTGAVTVSQQADVPSSNEFQSSLRIAVTTADASIAATDLLLVTQRIEGYNVRDLIGRTFTLSFWVRSSKTGIHCVAFRNSGADRSYVLEYTVNVANTWEQKSVTVSGGLITAGTWDWTTGVGLSVLFAAAAGSTFQTTAGAWQTGNFQATASQVNCLDTIGNIFAITGVQLEVGSVATPFEHLPYGLDLARAQRYYVRATPTAADQTLGVGHNTLTTAAVATLQFQQPMRTAPTALEQSGTATDYSVAHAATSTVCSAVPTFLTASPFAATTTFTVASGLTAGQGSRARAVNTSAYLAWSAEL